MSPLADCGLIPFVFMITSIKDNTFSVLFVCLLACYLAVCLENSSTLELREKLENHQAAIHEEFEVSKDLLIGENIFLTKLLGST